MAHDKQRFDFQKKTAKEQADEERRERQLYREQISDLDWWSKYYVTKDDAAKVNFVYPTTSEFLST